MAFSKKQPFIIYLTDTVLRVYKDNEQLKTIEVPTKKQGFQNTLKALFREEVSSLLGNNDVLVVLGGKLLYQKSFVLSEQTVGEEDKEAFFKDLPIPEDELARNTITTEHKVYLLGTNKVYYEALLSVTENVVSVLPLSLFSDDTSVDELTREQREDILKNTSLYEVGDFLVDNPFTPQASDETPTQDETTPHEQIVVKESSFNPMGLVKLIGISLVLAGLFFTGFVYLDQNGGKSPSESVTNETTPTPTVTPEVDTAAKEQLTIQVLNGTGTVGQAGAVETLLTEADFTNIEVGNAEEQDNQVTSVVISTRVSEEVSQEVQEVLETYFTEVEVTDATEEESEFDIVITTGTAS